MKIDELILKEFPDILLPDRYKLQSQITPIMNLINRFGILRQMTIVELLHSYYIEPIKNELSNSGELE